MNFQVCIFFPMLDKTAKLGEVIIPSSDIMESQNHRMVRVGRNLCGSSGLIPLPKQGHLEQAAQDLDQTGS